MSDADQHLMTVFTSALDFVSAAERDAYLEQACGADAALRSRVEALLRAHAGASRFLEPSPAAEAEQALSSQPTAVAGPVAGKAVAGRYKLLELIGEGGMGTVWMAEQTEPVKREVALKLIKAGMDSKQVIARFEAERQALALMDHANIARVLDAGTTSAGRPYFVMDLVKGVPITKYCDDHRLTPRQRLELFIPVCQAVQHAHQKGIIHRDLKPSNVLVAQYDGKPVPKVIDFGVAKAAGQSLTDKTLVTGFGNIVGTLEYMSPEQAEVNQLDIDTRSDIYSLGVLLYELLTGSPPFTRKVLEKAGVLEMLRVIREKEPSKPSTKLSTAEALPTLAANRGTEPAKLTRLVRGELDWIVMKALEKDRNRRYETANGFAMDVQRYLADEPVLAGPPSRSYRLRKFVRRNKRPVLAAALILLTLVSGITGTTLGLLQARGERDDKERAREAEAEQRTQADQARTKAEAALYRSLVSETRALLLSGREGWRAKALANLQRAAAIVTPERDLTALRTEAVAVLGGFDAEKIGSVPAAKFTWSLDFSPDGTRMATADSGGTVDLWDVRTGLKHEHRIVSRVDVPAQPTPDTALPSVRFHPDGKQFAYATWERSAVFAPLSPGAATLSSLTSQAQPRSIAFDRLGKIFAVTWSDGSLGVYDHAGKRLRRLPVVGANLAHQWMCVALSPNGQLLATLGVNNTIELYNLDTEKPPVVLGRHRYPIRALCFSSDGRSLASASLDRTAKIWSVAGGEPLTLLGHTARVNAVAFSPEGDFVATGSDDRTIRLWDARTGQSFLTLEAAGGEPVLSVGFSSDGHLGVAGQAISLYRIHRPVEHRQWHEEGHLIKGLDFHPSQNLLAVGGELNLTVYDLASGERVRWFNAFNNKAVGSLAVNRDGTRIAAGAVSHANSRPLDNHVRVWNAVTGALDRLLQGHNADVSSVAFDPAEQRLATAGTDGSVFIWDIASAKVQTKWQGPAGKPTLRFLGDGDRLVIWYPSGTAEIRATKDGRVVRQVSGIAGNPNAGEQASALAPGEQQLAVAGRDGAVHLLGLPELNLIETLTDGHRGAANLVAFSPDGRWLATVGDDRIVVLRDGRTFQKLMAFPPRVGPVSALAFDRHGNRLATAGGEQLITLANLDRIADELTRIGLTWEGATQKRPMVRDREAEVIPTGGAAHLRAGDRLRGFNDLDRAIDEYRTAVELDPKHLRARQALGFALLSKGRTDETIALCRKTIEIDPWSAADRMILGDALRRKNQLDEAIGEYRKAIEIQPKTASAIIAVAEILKDRNEVDAALVVLDEGLRHAAPDFRLWLTRGDCYALQKKWRAAISDFTESNRIRSEDPVTWEKRALAHLGARDADGFRRTCAAMVKAWDKPVISPFAANRVYWTTSLVPDAMLDVGAMLKMQEQLVAKMPNSWHCEITYGALLFRAGQYEKSVKRLTALSKLGPQADNGYRGLFLALAHHKLGHADEARRQLDQAVAWIDAAQQGKIKNPFIRIPLAWTDAVAMAVLRAEAESLIGKRDKNQEPEKASTPSGVDPPKV
jgi:WD40 repeat protein/serine/threonine protein kinase/predicted Zn-dependent protease